MASDVDIRRERVRARLLSVAHDAALSAVVEVAVDRIATLEAQVAECREKLEAVVNKGLDAGLREISDAAYAMDAAVVPKLTPRKARRRK